VASHGSSLKAIDEGSIWVMSWEMRLRGGVLPGRTVVVVNLGVVAFVAVLTSNMSSLGRSLRALGERFGRIVIGKVRGLITLVVRTIGALRQVVRVIVLVAVQAALVASFGSSLEALGEASIWIATWQVRRFVTLLILSGVIPVMLVTVLATLVIRLSSSLGAFGERAVRVATRQVRGGIINQCSWMHRGRDHAYGYSSRLCGPPQQRRRSPW
jgi:hypothetical protein